MKQGNVLVSIIAFFIIFFVFCGFAIDFSMITAARAQLQTAVETTVLIAAAEIKNNAAETTAKKVFLYSKTNGAKYSQIDDIQINQDSNAIFIKASAPAPTYFLSALGINTIELQAQAAAMLLPQELNNDTNFKLDNHLQYTSPILITNKPGPEIEVTKADNTEDYRIFAGLNDKTGEIKWLEITCTGKNLTDKKQFFDLEDDCINMENTNKIAFAQYLRIINNSSSAPLNIEKLRLLNAAKLISHKKFKNL